LNREKDMRNWVILFVVVSALIACGGKKEEAVAVSQSGGSTLGEQIGKPQPAESPSAKMNPELRKSFMEGCTGEIEESFGKEKSGIMCTCMLDKGLAKWELGDFMKKAMEGGPEVEKISLECMKLALGVEVPTETEVATTVETATATADGDDGMGAVKVSFVEGCVGPMKDTFGTAKATGICTCMFDEGTKKWSLGDFMKKAMEQGKEVEEIALKCMAADPIGGDEAAKSETPEATATATGDGNIRKTFIDGCVEPMVESFGRDKSAKICACMFDKGTAKWDLGEFMKKAMEQGEEVKKLAMECVTGNL
jgi:hypothetical protein